MAAPEAPAILDAGGAISRRQLAAVTVGFARNLQARGVDRQARVGIVSDDLAVVMASLFASALLGCTWVMAGPLGDLRGRAGITHLFDGSDADDRLPGAEPIDESWAKPPETGADQTPFPGYAAPEDNWILTQTSGTTGLPKLVALSFAAMTRRAKGTAAVLGHAAPRVCGLFPAAAPARFHRNIAALLHGGDIVEGASPDLWQSLGVSFVFGSGNQVRKVIGDRVLTPRLPRLQLWGHTPTEAELTQLLQSFEEVIVGYGATETSQSLRTVHRIGAAGRPEARTFLSPDTEVQCVDQSGQPLPPGQEGVVRIRNPHLASGYLDAPALWAEVCRDGWFYPGDLGLWTKEGLFRVTGRTRDQFNIGGSKINAALLDAAAVSADGVEDAVSFMLPRPDGTEVLRVMAVLAQGHAAPEVERALRLALVRLGPSFVPDRVLFTKDLPRTATGKADRAACVRQVQQTRARRQSGKKAGKW